jgi:hypothetical protein
MHTILIAADQKNKGNISPNMARTLHSDTLLAEYPFHGGGKGYSAEIVYYSI